MHALNFPVHSIPLWFLVFSLFLPRLCMVVAWFGHTMPRFIPATLPIVPAIIALLVPRLIILLWIYQDQGLTIWFLLHLIALLMAWGGGGSRMAKRGRSNK